MLLWPEGGIDSDPLVERVDGGDARRAVAARATPRSSSTPPRLAGEDTFNTSMLWVAGEGAVQMHDKRHPVPFGEYVPDRWFYEMLAPDLIGLIQREYTPGTNPAVLRPRRRSASASRSASTSSTTT